MSTDSPPTAVNPSAISHPPASSSTTAPQTSTPIDELVSAILSSSSYGALAQTLRQIPRETRDVVFSAPLSGGQDPLIVLGAGTEEGVRANTLGVLYVLAARLSTMNAPPPWDVIDTFCGAFDPEQARLAPTRVTQLGRGILRLAAQLGEPSQALPSLRALLTRFPPSPNCLTPLHALFATACASTRHFSFALPVLVHPISEISLALCPDLSYVDHLLYAYASGCVWIGLERWAEAEEALETVVCAPGAAASAVQLEAVKKLRMVGLILRGTVSPLPKYTHPAVARALKGTGYAALLAAYPSNNNNSSSSSLAELHRLLEKHRPEFAQDGNVGLVRRAVGAAPRWVVARLTRTYVTLAVGDVARSLGWGGGGAEERVRGLVLSMIESGTISARLSASGTVTFSDPAPAFSKADVDEVLRAAHAHAEGLTEVERGVGRGREFLGKALKSREGPAGAGGPGGPGGPGGAPALADWAGVDEGGAAMERFAERYAGGGGYVGASGGEEEGLFG